MPYYSPGDRVNYDGSGNRVVASSDQLRPLQSVQVYNFDTRPERVRPVEIISHPVHCQVLCLDIIIIEFCGVTSMTHFCMYNRYSLVTRLSSMDMCNYCEW